MAAPWERELADSTTFEGLSSSLSLQRDATGPACAVYELRGVCPGWRRALQRLHGYSIDGGIMMLKEDEGGNKGVLL